MQDQTAAKTLTRTAIRATFAAVGLFILLLIAVHLLKPELDPSWHFISEYAIGSHGWVMQAAFLALAAANIASFLSIEPYLRTLGGRVGSLLFLIGTFGLILAAFCITDPINTPPEALTTSGKLHNLGGGLGLLGFIGTLVFSVRLLIHPAWGSARTIVLIAAAILVLGFLIAFVSIASIAAEHKGVFGSDTPVGWPNRIGILTGCVWMLLISWQAGRIENRATEVLS